MTQANERAAGFTANHTQPEPGPELTNEERTIFETIAEEIGKLVKSKNAAYGSAYIKTADFLLLLFPKGIHPSRYGDALLLVRIFDKQMRIATRPDAFDESPYRDISGYGVLGVEKDMQFEGKGPKKGNEAPCVGEKV